MELTPAAAAVDAVTQVVTGSDGPGAPISLDSPALFCNRELSLLAFQERVLDEARDEANPLLDRVNFLSILGSNLNEFFMVRVAVLKQRLASGVVDVSPDGTTGQKELDAIAAEVKRIEQAALNCWDRSGKPRMNVCIHTLTALWRVP